MDANECFIATLGHPMTPISTSRSFNFRRRDKAPSYRRVTSQVLSALVCSRLIYTWLEANAHLAGTTSRSIGSSQYREQQRAVATEIRHLIGVLMYDW